MSEINRKCGTCVECCTALAVPELSKAAGERCRHLVSPGKCGIYEFRPESCRTYSCGWLVGSLSSQDRPDRSGFILEARDVPGGNEETPPAVVIRETRDGWALRKRAQALIRRVQDARLVFVLPMKGDRQVLGPTALVALAMEAAKKGGAS